MNTLDLIHAKCHGLRMIPKYQPSLFEIQINHLISDEYQNDCKECKLKLKELDLRAELGQLQPPAKQGVFAKIFK